MLQKLVNIIEKKSTVPSFSAQTKIVGKDNYRCSNTGNWENQALLTFCEPQKKGRGEVKEGVLLRNSLNRCVFPSIQHFLLRVKDLTSNACLYFHFALPPLFFNPCIHQTISQRRCSPIRLTKPPYKLLIPQET